MSRTDPGDKALAILRAGLPRRTGIDPTQHPNFTDFERALNEMPFPANPGPSLTFPDRKASRARKYWGTWLRSNNRPRFDAEFRAWRATK